MKPIRKPQQKARAPEAGGGGAPPSKRAARRPKAALQTEQQQTEEKLPEDAERYRLISEVVSDYVFSARVEADGSLRLNWVAGAFEAISGYTFEDYCARGGWPAALHPDDAEIDARDLQLIRQNRNVISTVRTLKKDGTVVWAQVYAHPVWDEANQRLAGIYGAVQDVTERKQAEIDLRQRNRALRTYSACGQALAHITDETLLLTEICKICVEIGGYRMAWIGYANQDPARIARPVASWGGAPAYPDPFDLDRADAADGQSPSGKAIRTGQAQIAQNILAAPEYAPWRAAALEQGFASYCGLPLMSGGRAWGVLNIYSVEPEAFDAAEVGLLANLAGDVAFGIEALRTRAENKRTVELLQASEERYRLLVDQSPYAITMFQDDAVVFANSAAARLFGAAGVDDLIGRAFETLVHPDYLAAAHYRIDRMLNGDSGLYPAESCYLRLDGRDIAVEVTATPFSYDGRQAVQMIALDITARKQAEQAQQDIQKQLSLIFESVGDVLFLLTVEAEDVYRFASVNPVFLATTGLRLDQVLGKRIEEVLPEAAHKPVKDQYRQAILTNQGVSWEEVSVYPSGTLYGKVTVTPAVDAGGVCTHLIGSVHDITQIRRAEQEIRKLNQELEGRVAERTRQLQAANKELESFSYSVSHDLRAPLRAISGFAEIIARRHRASLNAEGQHYFDNIVQASERMSQLIDDLLQYSRLGRQALRVQPVALSNLLAALAKDLEPRLAQMGGTLEIAGDLPQVTADKTLLNQIFTNLLENALTYRRSDVPPRLAVSWQAEDGAAVIGVRDNGIGIPEEHYQRIFNIFQRLHSDDLYPGTGIGLATVNKAAEMLGAHVWVESEVGAGSTFFVRLPKE